MAPEPRSQPAPQQPPLSPRGEILLRDHHPEAGPPRALPGAVLLHCGGIRQAGAWSQGPTSCHGEGSRLNPGPGTQALMRSLQAAPPLGEARPLEHVPPHQGVPGWDHPSGWCSGESLKTDSKELHVSRTI